MVSFETWYSIINESFFTNHTLEKMLYLRVSINVVVVLFKCVFISCNKLMLVYDHKCVETRIQYYVKALLEPKCVYAMSVSVLWVFVCEYVVLICKLMLMLIRTISIYDCIVFDLRFYPRD